MGNKSSYFKFVGAFAGIIAVAVGAYFIWNTFFKYDINEVYKKAEADYIAAMTADTYGGKTPQETLDLFVAALRSGDMELASKYFLIREEVPREEWVEYLSSVKERGLLTKMADDIEDRSVSDPKNRLDENDFKFVLYANAGEVGVRIDMQFNKYSNVWKIESF